LPVSGAPQSFATLPSSACGAKPVGGWIEPRQLALGLLGVGAAPEAAGGAAGGAVETGVLAHATKSQGSSSRRRTERAGAGRRMIDHGTPDSLRTNRAADYAFSSAEMPAISI
jgi:hypothetical protein